MFLKGKICKLTRTSLICNNAKLLENVSTIPAKRRAEIHYAEAFTQPLQVPVFLHRQVGLVQSLPERLVEIIGLGSLP